jgi:hypothetical protein
MTMTRDRACPHMSGLQAYRVATAYVEPIKIMIHVTSFQNLICKLMILEIARNLIIYLLVYDLFNATVSWAEYWRKNEY